MYVEKEVRDHPRTKRILDRLAGAEVIEIAHYKDVFCRKGQDYILQHRAQNLILGAKHGKLLYKGARVCQSFGNENFYYTSCMMNCVFDCEYCYLKGMYPSGNLVVFVNLEDIFAEAEKLLLKEELYLWGIGIDPHIDKLPLIKIPVGKDMNHRSGFVVGPCRLVHIEGIFFKTGCVYLSKIRIFGKIWRGLT